MKERTRQRRIAYAQSLGYVRCYPYRGEYKATPKWYWRGGYYSFDQIPRPNTEKTP